MCYGLINSLCDNGKGDNQPSNTPSNEKPIQSTQEIKNGKEKTNAEKFLDYVIEAAYLRKFTETGDYAGIAVHYMIYTKRILLILIPEVKGYML